MQYVQRERERAQITNYLAIYAKKKHPPPLKQSNPQLHLPMELSNLDCDSFGAEFIPRCLEVVDLGKYWLPGGCQNQLINQQTYKWIDLFVRKKSIKIEIPLYWTWESGFLQLEHLASIILRDLCMPKGSDSAANLFSQQFVLTHPSPLCKPSWDHIIFQKPTTRKQDPIIFHNSPPSDRVLHQPNHQILRIAWPLRLPSSGANWSTILTSHLCRWVTSTVMMAIDAKKHHWELCVYNVPR